MLNNAGIFLSTNLDKSRFIIIRWQHLLCTCFTYRRCACGHDETSKTSPTSEFLLTTQRGDLIGLKNLTDQHNIEDWTIFRHEVSGDTALHVAAREGYLEIVEYLCNHWQHPAFKVNVVNRDMKCPLHDAAQFSRCDIVNFLVDQGALVNSLKRADWTPLMMACTKDGVAALDSINRLLEAGADPTIRNKDGWTSLHVACRVGNVRIIKSLLEANPECATITTNNGRTTLHIAGIYAKASFAFHGHIDAMDALISTQSDLLCARDSSGVTPLHEAIKSGNFNAFKHLINLGADIHAVDGIGQTILHVAASVGNIDVIGYILANGLIDIHCEDKFGITPLAVAQRNKVENNCIDLLMQYI